MGNAVSRHELTAEKKRAEVVRSKQESTKRAREAKEMQTKNNHNLENERKNERAKQVKMKLEASKRAKAVEVLKQLHVKKDKN